MYRINETERREVYRQLVAKPADEIHSLLMDQLDSVNRIPDIQSDPRRGMLQQYIDTGDRLKASDTEPDRKERRKSYALAFLLGLAILDDSDSQNTRGDAPLFYRGASAGDHYVAAAGRLLSSLVLSFRHLDDATWAEIQRLINPDNLWGLALVLGGWFLATVVGGWIGLIVNGILLVVGILDLWERIKASWSSFKQWFWLSYKADSQADLETAGKHFADGAAVGGLAILEVVILHYAFRAIETKLIERFKTPEWIKRAYSDAVAKERARRASEPKRERPPEERPPKERPPEERPPDERPPEERPAEGKKGRRRGTDAIKAVGAVRVGDELGLDGALPWVALLAVGLGAAYAAGRRRRGIP